MSLKLEKKILLLKTEIKDWEYSFTKQHGSKPGHSDIKANSEMQAKYKKYSHYKKHLKHLEDRLLQELKQSLVTPTKNRLRDVFSTPQRESETPGTQVASPFPMKEIGPTPQLQGRVLSIFDIPAGSPKSATLEEISSDVEDTEHQVKVEPAQNAPKSVVSANRIVNSIKSEPTFKTPTKKRVIQYENKVQTPIGVGAGTTGPVMETPAYLKHTSKAMAFQLEPNSKSLSQEEVYKLDLDRLKPVQEANISKMLRFETPNKPVLEFSEEPSPMLSPVRRKVKRKSLFEMMQELEEINNEDIDKLILEENGAELGNVKREDADDIDKFILDENKDALDPVDESEGISVKKKRAKTQKRSTKRRKIRPMGVESKDELSGVDIHLKMASLKEQQLSAGDVDGGIDDSDDEDHNERILNELDDDDEVSSYASESESEYESDVENAEGVEDADKAEPGKFQLLNNNFVRMKIHYKKNKNFRRRR